MDFQNFHNFLHTLLSPYGIDGKWYPFILIGVALLFLLLVYIIFAYIRAFFSWIFGNSEILAEAKYQTEILEEMLVTQKEQLDILQALFIENSLDEEEEVPTEKVGQIEQCPQPKKKYHHHHHKKSQSNQKSQSQNQQKNPQ